MKATLFFFTSVLFLSSISKAQVTRINNNKSLGFNYPLSNTKQIFVSNIDQTLWVTDGTLAGTIQLSSVITFDEGIGSIVFLDGKYIFAGSTSGTGSEVYITDGTPGGTVLVKDINPGTPASNPMTLATLNGFIYFTANNGTDGEELWRTNGTPGGTTMVKDVNPGPPGSSIDREVGYLGGFLFFTAETAADGRELWKTDGTTTAIVKDIVPGPGGSNYPNAYELTSTPTYLLFMARTASSGVELWISDGSTGGTVLLKDINAGPDSSNARFFSLVNNLVLFAATDATHGDELWKTDGTPGGTTILKDINVGGGSSTGLPFIPGFDYPIFSSFHIFNNKAYFIANDGSSTGELWVTDGSTTSLVKNIVQNTSLPLPAINVTSALNLSNKFIFSVSDNASRSELWESDGTPGGTVLFKAFAPAMPAAPIIFNPFSFTAGTPNLFQGNKFFFSAGTAAEGTELWISDGVDGTTAHTYIVKDINPGAPDSNPGFPFPLYTATEIFFPANTATNGLELWRSDGTTAGTKIVLDININPTTTEDANPFLDFFILNGKILFEATDGDNATETDLFVVDGSFSPLPIKLSDFTVTPVGSDGLLQWKILQETNTKEYTIQRSFDGEHFENIGTVQAAGTTSNTHNYMFTDIGIITSGKNIVYYRLVASGIDGKTENTNIILLKIKNTGTWAIRLLSNPVPENLKVLLSGTQGLVQFSIKDIGGKTVYTNSIQDINGQITLPANLQRGVYLLIVHANNEQKVKKFVRF